MSLPTLPLPLSVVTSAANVSISAVNVPAKKIEPAAPVAVDNSEEEEEIDDDEEMSLKIDESSGRV